MELAFRQNFVSVLLICAAVLVLVQGQDLKAKCVVKKNSGIGPVSGTIELTQPKGGNVTLSINLKDLPAGQHGFHVHVTGSLDNNCTAAGAHLNVDGTSHGAPNDPKDKRHTGDLGNIEVPTGSTSVQTTIIDWLISLDGQNSVIGKPIVIHENVDDLGRGGSPLSNTTGNAGNRLGCCLIEKSGAQTIATKISLTTLLLLCLPAFLFRATLNE